MWLEHGELDLVGRDEDLASLASLAARSPLVTVLGPGGVGKTRLVSLWAADRAEPVPVVPLAAEQTLPGAAQAVAAGLKVGTEGAPTPEALLERTGRRWRGRTVVLDNLEQLEDAARIVAPLLDAGVRIVATSRRPTGHPREQPLHLEPLSVEAGVALFGRRAAGRAPTTPDQDAVRRLVAAVDRLPFAIELASSRVGVLSPDQILARLDRLRSDHGEPRHRSVEACLEVSWRALGTSEQAGLAALCRFTTPFSVDDAEAVLGDEALELVERLWSWSWLQRRDGGWVTFGVLDLVRAFTAGRCPPDLAAAWRERVLARAEAGGDDLRHMRPDLWGVLSDPDATVEDRARVRSALRTLVSIAPASWLPWFEGADADRSALSATLDGRVAIARAAALFGAGRPVVATEVLQASLDRARAEGDPVVAELLTQRALFAVRRGAYPEAIDDLRVAAPSLRGAHLAVALERLGDALRMQGDFAEAEEAQRRALATWVELGSAPGQAACWSHLAHLAGARGDRDGALSAYVRAEQLAAEPEQRGRIRFNRINYESTWGDPADALARVASALADAEASGNDELRALVLGLAALASLPAGEPPERTLSRVEEALATLVETGQHGVALAVRMTAAIAHGLAGNADDALVALALAEEEARRWSLPPLISVGGIRALVALRAGRRAEAEAVDLERTCADETVRRLARLALAGDEDALRAEVAVLDRVGTICARRSVARLAGSLVTLPTTLRLAADGDWYELAGRRVDLRRRGPMRRLLVALARARGEVLSTDDLIELGWPEERILPDAARMRLHTAVRTLRKTGLGELIETVEGGYRLSPGTVCDLGDR
ncbi:MAG: tetratricopeptide repeat protein [Alphaproteobacteria bacterium]|nr:tetratricopeptide repeat protein [Alphaproteobacteria bacterium]MCB9700062.1 tetratricopeptide repeat protein [Alphaproteobacteria bacterium]